MQRTTKKPAGMLVNLAGYNLDIRVSGGQG
jgi:hypothetical protein